MNRILAFIFSVVAFPLMAANPSFQDFQSSQFGTTGNKVVVKNGALLTNTVIQGTATIGGRLLATNTVSNGGTNHFAGTLNSATNISSQGIFHGNGLGLSNALSVAAGPNVTIVTNGPNSLTIASSVGSTYWNTNQASAGSITNSGGGNVGIGTYTPTTKLQVNGLVYANNGLTDTILDNTVGDFVGSLLNWRLRTGANGRLAIDTYTGGWAERISVLVNGAITIAPASGNDLNINLGATSKMAVNGLLAVNHSMTDTINNDTVGDLVGTGLNWRFRTGANGRLALDTYSGGWAERVSIPVSGVIYGDGAGMSNTVDLIAGSGVTISTNANRRTYTFVADGHWQTNIAAAGSISNKYGGQVAINSGTNPIPFTLNSSGLGPYINYANAGVDQWQVGVDGGAGAGKFMWYRGGFKLVINTNGNLGVGVVGALNKLDVSGGAVFGSGLAGTVTAPAGGVLAQGDVASISGVIHGNAPGVSNAVDLIAGSNINITSNANNRTFTIASRVFTNNTDLAGVVNGGLGIGTNFPFEPYILYTNGSGTNTTFYGPLIAADYLYATNSGRTNKISGKIEGVGGIASGAGGIALGLNNQSSAYSIGVGIGNKSFGNGTIIGGISNAAFSGSQYSLVSGGSNSVSGPHEFVSGSRNSVEGENSAAIGSDITFVANAHNSVGIGTGINFTASPSNTIAISAGTGGISVTRSNAIYLNSVSGVFVSGGPITGNGAGLTGVPVAGVSGIRHGISGSMVLGTVTVTDTGCTANTRYFFSAHTLGTISIPGGYYASTRNVGTSFVISSSQATETSTIDWMAIEP